MKKIILILSIFLLLVPLFGAEQVWFMHSTRMTDNINLEDVYYLPNYTKTWTQDKSLGDPIKGTYSTINTLGNFGVMACDHKLCFTVITDGKFTSLSDSSKYRNYSLAMRPRCRIKSGSDTDYNRGSNGIRVETSERLINTKLTGSMSYITPPVSASGSAVPIDAAGTIKTIDRFHADLIIILDELSPEDKQHVAEKDDYTATFTIDWHCEEDGCTNPNHYGSYTVVLRGYYGDNDPTYSLVTLFAKPNANASSLDIMKVLKDENGKAKIADLSFYCASKAKYNWNDKIFVFLSANSDSKTANTYGFQLVNKETHQTIPYNVNVYDSNGMLVGAFDGKDKSSNSKPAHYIDFRNSTLTMNDREGNKSYSIIFEGDVEIDFGPSGLTPDQISSNLILYGGTYTSTIYYYVITSENSYI